MTRRELYCGRHGLEVKVSSSADPWRVAKVLACALLVPIVPFLILGELPGERWLSGHDDNALQFGVVGALLLALDVVLPIPSSIVGSLLGARLGMTWGFAAAFTGLSCGSLAGYFLGLLLPSRLKVDLPLAPSLVAVFLSRPVPVLAEATVVAAGAARVGFRGFCLSALLGNAIYAGALCASGSAWLPDAWLGPGLIVPFALPVLAWLVWRRVRTRRARDAAD